MDRDQKEEAEEKEEMKKEEEEEEEEKNEEGEVKDDEETDNQEQVKKEEEGGGGGGKDLPKEKRKPQPQPQSYQENESVIKEFSPSKTLTYLLENMLCEEDLIQTLEKQESTIQRFEAINKSLSVYNEFSAKRYNEVNKEFERHVKMLITMKNDLDSIFRRIRTLQNKLGKQYPEAFEQMENHS